MEEPERFARRFAEKLEQLRMGVDFHKLVPIPAPENMNTGLSPAHQATMLKLLGKPGRLTQNCSPITNLDLKRKIVIANVGPFTVTGHKAAVQSLTDVFADVKAANPALYSVVKTAGMLCCRAVRGSDSSFSNHSWGTAIDIEIESELDALGARQVQQGILLLYPYFHRHGFYWGAGFSRPDGMHFELADETIRDLARKGLL